MRAREFLLEYSREKTAGVFGKKLLTALGNDRGERNTALGMSLQSAKNDQGELSTELAQNVLNALMAKLESADPTANKEYVQWLAKVYANEGVMLEDLLSKTAEWLQSYDLYKKKRFFTGPDAKLANIMNLKWRDLWDISIRADFQMKVQSAEEKAMAKGDAEQVFENGQVRIIVPKDQAAACYYGQGTQWCTASTQSTNYFNQYNKEGPMYILLPKKPQYDGEKYQLHFPSGQFMDEQDRNVDVVELLDMRFGNLVDFFREEEPIINDWLVFTPDEMLEPLIEKIKVAVRDHLSEMAHDWEAEDDYWYAYLREKGYVDAEGDIDWDKVYDANESYLEWNYEASDFISDINTAVDLSPSEVKEMAQEVASEWGADDQNIDDLDKIFAYAVEQARSRTRDGDAGVAEWIHEHIYIKKREGKWDVSTLWIQKDGTRKEYAIHI